MKILVTGANGFIGRNLITTLKQLQHEILPVEVDTPKEKIEEYARDCQFLIHLAGVNRPLKKEDFYEGNANFTFELTQLLKKYHNKCPIIFASSIKAEQDSDYGVSKRIAEDMLLYFAKMEDNPLYIYRLSNVFGKWCRPNYNSVIATFCYNIAHDLPISISDEYACVPFVYIDDIVNEFINVINGEKRDDELLEVTPIYNVRLKELVDLIKKFKDSRNSLVIPKMDGEFESKLYATYLSYIEPTNYAYPLKMNVDNRGSFTEFLRSDDAGQVSINVAHVGIIKGNHWHHTKNEKFLVVKGKAIIKLRKIDEEKIYSYEVSGDELKVVDIPVGYTHSIANVGDCDLITIMWASEPFNKDKPDTYFLEVEPCKN